VLLCGWVTVIQVLLPSFRTVNPLAYLIFVEKLVVFVCSVGLEQADAISKKKTVLNLCMGDKKKNGDKIEPPMFYMENGLVVFTREYHLKRGTCCKSGCRHCPYGFQKESSKAN
jgi:hypothetical protein